MLYGMSGGRGRIVLIGLVAGMLVASGSGFAATASGQGFVNWPGYLHDTTHSSASAATAVSRTSAAGLHSAWRFVPDPPNQAGQPAAGFQSSPVVANGVVYVGATTGELYALNETTGKVIWKQFTGYQPKLTCPARGIASTQRCLRIL
jgi:outer membrane protein assembly factor BamB